MAEPTQEQKLAAARAALAALDPPVTESIIGDRLVEATVAIVWSQLALVEPSTPVSAPPATIGPMFFQGYVPPTPELAAKVKAYNERGAALAEEIIHTPVPSPTGYVQDTSGQSTLEQERRRDAALRGTKQTLELFIEEMSEVEAEIAALRRDRTPEAGDEDVS